MEGTILRFTILLICAVLGFSAQCAELSRIAFSKELSIVIDGNLDGKEWSEATKIDLDFETWPGDSTPTEKQYKTDVFIIEDGNSLYIAAKAYDPTPQAVNASLHRRDRIGQQDSFTISIDTFGMGQEAFVFEVTPLGGQSDHIKENNSGDKDWDGLWTSKGKLTEFGYEIEIEIPISNFRFPDKGIQNWNIKFNRDAHRKVSKTWSSSKVNRDNTCRICQHQQFSLFENVKQTSALLFRPSVIATRSNQRDYPYTDKFVSQNETAFGLDLRWSPSGDQVFNGTINPDFSQVEADQAQSAVNRLFSIFYSEKRPFFLEGQDYFNTAMSLVHTRNISDPELGLKYTGRFGDNAIGIFSANDTITNFYTPGQFENGFESLNEKSSNTVARYRYSLDEGSYLGALVTNRNSTSYKNQVVSLDGFYRFTDSIRMTFQYASSVNTYNDVKKNGDALLVEYNFNTDTDWHYLIYKEKDLDFNSGLGFITRTGVTNLVGGVGHVWRIDDTKNFLESIYISTNYDEERLKDSASKNGEKIYSYHDIELTITGRNQLELEIRPFKLTEVYLDTPYSYNRFYYGMSYRLNSNLKVGGYYEDGKQTDYSNNRLAKGSNYNVWAKVNLGEGFAANLEMQRNTLKVNGARIFTEDLTNASVEYSINLNHHLRLTHQEISGIFNPFEYGFFIDEKIEDSAYQALYIFEHSSYSSIYVGYSSSGFRDSTFNKTEISEEYFFTKFNYSFSL